MTIAHIIAPGLGGLVAGWIGISSALVLLPAIFMLVFVVTRIIGARLQRIPASDKQSDAQVFRTS
jgi:hypothetical protein